jgi:beta-galactosidase
VAQRSHLSWKVKYAPGTLTAVGYRGGEQVLTDTRTTTTAPTRIELRGETRPLAADGEDVLFVRASVVDAEGRLVPVASDEIEFRIQGPAKLIGVGNGDPSSHESDRGPKRRAFGGLCMAIVQTSVTPGSIRIEAASGQLTAGTLVIASNAAQSRASA